MFIPEKLSDKGSKFAVKIYGMVEEGIGSNAIYRDFRAKGISYDRNKMMSDIRQYRIAKEKGEAVKRLPGFQLAPMDYVQKPKYTTITDRYACVITGKFKDVDMDEEVELTRTFSFDSMMPKSKMVESFKDAMRDNPSNPQFEFIKGEVQYIFKGGRK